MNLEQGLMVLAIGAIWCLVALGLGITLGRWFRGRFQ